VLYEPNTAEALAEKWAEVLVNPEKIQQMSEDGRKSVLENFTTDILTKKVLKVYEKVTNDFQSDQRIAV